MDRTTRSRLAWAIAAAMGFCFGVIIGYIVISSGSGADGFQSFDYWALNPIHSRSIVWGLFGALVGIGLLSIRRLTAR